MYEQLPIATILLIAATCVVSIRAFGNRSLQDKLIFCPELILARKEYYRVVTSAFLHADSRHLIFNMLTLYLFGRNMETVMGIERFLIVYLASVIGGSLLSLYLHRNHEYYALGASGGVCGIVFASIFLFPGGDIFMMFIPVGIPSWLFAILFLLGEFVGVRTQRTNIGHDAHLGGAIIGLLTTTAYYPEIVTGSPRLYAAVMGLTLVMFVYFWRNPMHLPFSSFFGERSRQPVPKQKQAPTSEEVDAILEKVSAKGLDGLSEKERRILKDASKR